MKNFTSKDREGEMDMKKKTRILAALLTVIMVLTSVNTDAIGAVANSTTQSDYSSKTQELTSETLKDKDKNVTTTEAQKETSESTTEVQKETKASEATSETQKDKEKSTETSATKETKKEDEKTTEDKTDEDTIETMDTLLAISWKDGSNIVGRRPEHIRDLVNIYADGEELDNKKLSIQLLNKDKDGDGKADADKSYGLETYYYKISNLAVYKKQDTSEQKKEKIKYTVKEDTSKIKGYQKIETSLLDLKDGKPKGNLLAPEAELTLKSYDGKEKEDTDRFVNYLPEYTVSGSITWNLDEQEMSASDVIDIKDYFKDYFVVEIGDTQYQYHTVTYNKDKKDENIWNYSISGLFQTDKNGKTVSYTLNPSTIEGVKVSPTSETISKDSRDVNFQYNLSGSGIKMLDVGDQNQTYTHNGKASTEIVWYDTTGTDTNAHPGELKLEVSYQIGDNDYKITDLNWGKDKDGKDCYVHTYTDDEITRLGLSKEEDGHNPQLYIYDNGENSLNRTLSASGLTDSIKKGESTQKVEWSIKVTGVNYTQKDDSDIITGYSVKKVGDKYQLYSLRKLEVKIEVHAGHDHSKIDFWNTVLHKEMGLEFEGYTGDKYSEEKLAEYFKEHYGIANFHVDLNQNKEVCTIFNLPYYNEAKTEMEYAVVMKDPKLDPNPSDPNEWYTIEYNNTSVPGHGTKIDGAYNGGTIILTRTGKTDYTAYKIWQDEEDENEDHIGDDRPNTTWTLWRYSDKNGSYKTASQVFTDLDGKPITVTSYGCDEKSGDRLSSTNLIGKLLEKVTGDNHTNEMSVTEWKTHGYTVEEFVIENNLPAYDPEGYRYIYFTRESKPDNNYQQYYGSKAENSGIFVDSDVLPEDSDHQQITTRPSNDTSIYNGGAVANRKTATTTVSVTKKWNAAHYQNQLSNIEVELTLQAKHKNDQESYGGGSQSEKNDWYTVKDTKGDDVKVTLSGFDAYHLSKTKEIQTNQYCDNGHELVFRWTESKIYEVSIDEKTGEKTRKEMKPSTEDGETRYRLTINQEAIENDSYEHGDEYFVPETPKTDYIEAGGKQELTNTLKGTTEYYVKKTWKDSTQVDAIEVTLEQISSTGEVKKIVKTLSVDTPISKDNKKKAYGGDYSSRDSGWIHLFEDLPKYDENGNLYNYIVKETTSQYDADYNYKHDVDNDETNEKNSVEIVNRNPGVEKHIDVRKTWLDDSVTEDRDDCYFTVYTSSGQLLYGNVDNKEGFLSKEFVKITEDSQWWKRVGVTMFTYKEKDDNAQVFLRKTGEGYIDSDGNTFASWKDVADKNSDSCKDENEWQRKHLYNGGFYITEYQVGSNKVDTVNTNSMNYPTVESNHSKYVTIYYHQDGDNTTNYENTNKIDQEGYYTIINRRVGKMSYTVTKKWQDGMKDATDRQKWDAKLTLSCVEDEGIVRDLNKDANGKKTEEKYGYAQLPINQDKLDSNANDFVHEILKHEQYGDRPIYKEDEKTQTSITQTLGNTDKDSNTETVTYTNLPMYDVYGRHVHYSVTEDKNREVNGEKCDYSVSYGEKEYKNENNQTAEEKQTITNTLDDTKEYSWHLLWLDAYRNGQGHRPDVYLTVYYKEYEYNENGKIKTDEDGKEIYTIKEYGFTEYLWNKHQSDPDNNEWWKATFDLPEYDSHGTKREYYASIHESVDKGGFEYIDTQLAKGDDISKVDKFKEDGVNQSTVTFENGKYKVTTGESDVTTSGEFGSETCYLLAAGNTFVNQLKEDVMINGHKVWEKLPEGYPVEELPKLTFYMYRIKMEDGKYLLADGSTTSEYDENGTHEMVNHADSKKVLQVTSNGKSMKYQVELVSAIKDLQSSSTTYDFVMKHVGYNTVTGDSEGDKSNDWEELKKDYNVIEAEYGSEIAKYDECGHMYKYTIVETVSEDKQDHVDIAYNGLSGTINGYNIINTFNDIGNNTAPVTLQKNWESKYENVSITDYPDTTYTLYRFYKKAHARGDYSQVEKVKSVTLKAEDAKEGKVDFGNQLIYSPNLNPYIYFIVETPVKGYENKGFTLPDNIVEVKEEKDETGWPSMSGKDTAYPKMNTPKGWGSLAFHLKETSGDTDTNEDAISTTNTYTAYPQATLSGEKVWNDYNNAFDTRPDTLTLYVGRYVVYADSKNQESDFELVGSLTLKKDKNENLTADWTNADIDDNGQLINDWENVTSMTKKGGNNVSGLIQATFKVEDKEKWSYTLEGLDGYYTSGQPYDYVVFELTEDGKLQNYTADKGWAEAVNESGTNNRKIKMEDLKNSNLTSVTVKKEWKDLNANIEMPKVEVELQVGITGTDDDNVTWHWAKEYFKDCYSKFKYTSSYEQTLNHANNWQYTYSKLPAGYMDGETYKEFQYRVREIKIGDIDVNYNNNAQGNKSTVEPTGNQSVPYTIDISNNNKKPKEFTITNTPEDETKTLTVTKNWENDSDNAYHTRGNANGNTDGKWSVAYHIHRKYKDDEKDIDETVMQPNGTDQYVLYVSGDNSESTSSATIDKLPAKSPSGKDYTYYAVELDVDGKEITNNTYHGSYTISNDALKTTYTNELETTQLSVTKKWDKDQTTMRPENINLTLYRKVGEDSPEKVTYHEKVSWDKNDNSWTVTYTGLPKYNKDGNAYHYYVAESQQDGYERPEYSGGKTCSTQDAVENFSETITNTATQFTLDKVAEDGTSKLNNVALEFTGQGNRSGITLIWNRDGDGKESYKIKKGSEIFAEGSSNNDPVNITGLPTGTYKLTLETAPNGYTVPKNINLQEFTMNTDGTISVTNNDLLSVNEENLKLTLKNNPTGITLKKVDSNNVEIPKGYQFSVSGTFCKDDSKTEDGVRYLGTVLDNPTKLAKGMLLTSSTTEKNSNNWKPKYLYQLQETKAPVGYTVSDYTVSFYLDEFGAVKIYAIKDEQNTAVNEDKWAEIVSVSGTEITFKDEPFKITIVKTNEKNEKLSNAEFQLEAYKKETGNWETITDDLKTNGSGEVSINSVDKNLSVGGIYKITEIKAPDGYILPSEMNDKGEVTSYKSAFVFKVEKNGSISTGTVNNQGTFAPDEKNLAMNNTLTFIDDPISITIEKEDFSDSTTKLSDVEFELYKKDDEKLLSELQTDDSGKVIIPSSVLAYGNIYQLYEKNYIGYVNEDTGKRLVYEFNINANGTVTEIGDYKFGQVVNENQKATITLKNTRIPGTLKVMKVDDTDTSKGLKGAEFTLYKEDGITVMGDVFDGENTTQNRTNNPATTDDKGEAVFENLPWGTYVLKETKAPSGYQRTDTEWKITIGKTGTEIVLVASETVQNTKNVFSFQKYAQGTETSLSGAKFQLKPASADDKFATTDVSGMDQKFDAKTTDDGKGITWTSVKESPLELKGYLIAGNSYILTEESAPTGYEKNQKSYTFTVSEDGKTLKGKDSNDTDGVTIVNDRTLLQVYDIPIEITLQKQDVADGKKLADVEFSLETFDKTKNEWTFVSMDNKKLDGEASAIKTDNNGKAVLSSSDGMSLVTANAKYRLTETKTPDGYVIYNPVLTVVFTVREDGTIVLDRSSSILASAKDNTLIVKNVKTKLYLKKVDNETGKRLSGSTLEIYMASDFETEQGELTKPKFGAKAVITVTSEGKTITKEGLLDNTDYVLYEKEAPSGYDSFAPVAFELKNDVVILKDKIRTDITVSGPNADKNYTITAKDTRIRGHVKLTKLVNDSEKNKLANVEFSLYRVNGKEDTKIASGLTTDENGEWTSEENTKDQFMENGEKVDFAKGLTTGSYYFVETKTTAGTTLNTDHHSFTIDDSDTGANGKLETVKVVNEVFAASVSLTKLDEVSGKGISNVQFDLTCIPEGGSEKDKTTQTGTTDKDGKLTFGNLQKGRYTLTETVADGYDISQKHDEKHQPFSATFTINEAHQGKEIVLDSAAKGDKKLNLQVTQGSLSEKGITNARFLGTVTLYKADGDDANKALNDVEFTLYKQKESSNLWDKIQSFFTGKSYSKLESWSGKKLDEVGKLEINDLDWGTYKLVETKAEDGYTTTDGKTGQAFETMEFVIDRNSDKYIELTANGEKFYNYQTSLLIKKQSQDGKALSGAEFDLAGKYVNKDGKTVDGTLTLTTDQEGIITLKGVLISSETYTLTEKKAPDGYKRLTDPLEFKVEEDGIVSVTKEASGYELTKSEFFDNQIEIVNQKVSDKNKTSESRKTDKTKITKNPPVSSKVKTGDASSIGLWFILMCIAATILFFVYKRDRKN